MSASRYLILVLTVTIPAWAGVSRAQDYPAPELDPAMPGPLSTPDVAAEPMPPVGEPIPWDYEWTRSNRRGNVNQHRGYGSPDDGAYYREHVVTNPQGQRVQAWERTQNEEGYLLRRGHTFTDPDGALLHEHQMTIRGTDPFNYEREHSHTLRDGRSITHSQTRTWDGSTGTLEQSFVGPNGQVREFSRSWSPDPAPSEKPSAIANFFRKLNPFAKGDRPSSTRPSSTGRRGGFTLGSAGQGASPGNRFGLSGEQPGKPALNAHRIEAKQRVGANVAARPNPSQGTSRRP